ncbi:SCF ubiquitin ligase complex subunit cdc4 [Phlyctochytrium bullatum]|nr:SCF ubiquitin ligase complex subunit cdc4 [Phlyctochytrium bullatum]
MASTDTAATTTPSFAQPSTEPAQQPPSPSGSVGTLHCVMRPVSAVSPAPSSTTALAAKVGKDATLLTASTIASADTVITTGPMHSGDRPPLQPPATVHPPSAALTTPTPQPSRLLDLAPAAGGCDDHTPTDDCMIPSSHPHTSRHEAARPIYITPQHHRHLPFHPTPPTAAPPPPPEHMVRNAASPGVPLTPFAEATATKLPDADDGSVDGTVSEDSMASSPLRNRMPQPPPLQGPGSLITATQAGTTPSTSPVPVEFGASDTEAMATGGFDAEEEAAVPPSVVSPIINAAGWYRSVRRGTSLVAGSHTGVDAGLPPLMSVSTHRLAPASVGGPVAASPTPLCSPGGIAALGIAVPAPADNPSTEEPSDVPLVVALASQEQETATPGSDAHDSVEPAAASGDGGAGTNLPSPTLSPTALAPPLSAAAGVPDDPVTSETAQPNMTEATASTTKLDAEPALLATTHLAMPAAPRLRVLSTPVLPSSALSFGAGPFAAAHPVWAMPGETETRLARNAGDAGAGSATAESEAPGAASDKPAVPASATAPIALPPALAGPACLPPHIASQFLPGLVATFDPLPSRAKAHIVLQLLNRLAPADLQFVSSLVLPALKRDFLGLLPVELGYQVLEHLDLRSLGRCARVSRGWRRVVEGEGAEVGVWKRRLVREGWFSRAEVAREEERFRRELYERRVAARARAAVVAAGKGKEPAAGSRGCEHERAAMEAALLVGLDGAEGAVRGGMAELMGWSENLAETAAASFEDSAAVAAGEATSSYLEDGDASDLDEDEEEGWADAVGEEVGLVLEGGAGDGHGEEEEEEEEEALSALSCCCEGGGRWAAAAGTLPRCVCDGLGRTTMPVKQHAETSGAAPAAEPSSSVLGGAPGARRSLVGGLPVVDLPERPKVHKSLFKRHYATRQNWNKGRCKTISFPGHGTNVVTCLQFDDEKIVSGSDDTTIHVYDVNNGRLLKKLKGHEGGVWALQYWNDTLVSGSTDRTVRVWDLETGRCSHIFDGHTSTVRCLMIVTPTASTDLGPATSNLSTSSQSSAASTSSSVDPPFPLIVTGSRDATLRVWRLPDPKSALAGEEAATGAGYFMHVLNGHTNSVRAIAGHGRVLVSGSYDSTVRVWDLVTGEAVHCFRGHREKVYSVGYSHELRRAVSGSMDATVRVWCTRTGAALFNLEGHSSLVGLLELSPTYLVSAAADATLRVWCPLTGQCLATLTGHSHAITCFHHDPALNRIVSGSDGGIKVWELSSAPQATAAAASAAATAASAAAAAAAGAGTDGFGAMPPLSTIPPAAAPIPLSDLAAARGASGGPGFAYTQGPNGPQPVHGRFIRDLVSSIQGVWRVRMDERRMVSAIQKEGGRTWFEVLDFGDGVEAGSRVDGPGDGDDEVPPLVPNGENEPEEGGEEGLEGEGDEFGNAGEGEGGAQEGDADDGNQDAMGAAGGEAEAIDEFPNMFSQLPGSVVSDLAEPVNHFLDTVISENEAGSSSQHGEGLGHQASHRHQEHRHPLFANIHHHPYQVNREPFPQYVIMGHLNQMHRHSSRGAADTGNEGQGPSASRASSLSASGMQGNDNVIEGFAHPSSSAFSETQHTSFFSDSQRAENDASSGAGRPSTGGVFSFGYGPFFRARSFGSVGVSSAGLGGPHRGGVSGAGGGAGSGSSTAFSFSSLLGGSSATAVLPTSTGVPSEGSGGRSETGATSEGMRAADALGAIADAEVPRSVVDESYHGGPSPQNVSPFHLLGGLTDCNPFTRTGASSSSSSTSWLPRASESVRRKSVPLAAYMAPGLSASPLTLTSETEGLSGDSSASRGVGSSGVGSQPSFGAVGSERQRDNRNV